MMTLHLQNQINTMIDSLTSVVTQPGGFSIHMQGSVQSPPLSLLFVGTILFAYGFILYRRYRLLQDTPRIHARAVAMGFVHVRGKTVGNETQTLKSPITKLPCCYYSWSIEKYLLDQKNHWFSIFRDTKSCRFYIDDGTGRVLVNPAGAQFELPRTLVATTGVGQTDNIQLNPAFNINIDTAPGVAPSSEPELLRLKTGVDENRQVLSHEHIDDAMKQEILKRGYPDNARYRFTETCLPIGQEVAVFGTCSENSNFSDGSAIEKGQRDKILLITSNQEAKAGTKLRSRSIMIVAAGAAVLFLSFASCRPIMRTVPGSEVHSSK